MQRILVIIATRLLPWNKDLRYSVEKVFSDDSLTVFSSCLSSRDRVSRDQLMAERLVEHASSDGEVPRAYVLRSNGA